MVQSSIYRGTTESRRCSNRAVPADPFFLYFMVKVFTPGLRSSWGIHTPQAPRSASARPCLPNDTILSNPRAALDAPDLAALAYALSPEALVLKRALKDTRATVPVKLTVTEGPTVSRSTHSLTVPVKVCAEEMCPYPDRLPTNESSLPCTHPAMM